MRRKKWTKRFKQGRKIAGKKRLKRGRLNEIIQKVKSKNDLLDDVPVSKSMIHQRTKGAAVVEVTHPGTTSPLSSIEAQVVQILIQMAQIRQCLAPIEVVQLVNSLINGTQVQKDLIALKNKLSR